MTLNDKSIGPLQTLIRHPKTGIIAGLYGITKRGNPLANSPQARKRARQNTIRRELNMSQRSAMRTTVKNCQKSLAAGDSEAAASAYQTAVAAVDRAARKGLTHQNKADRLKSRLNTRLRALSASS